MKVNNSINTSLFVSVGDPPSYNQDGYSSMQMTRCGSITSLGEIGGKASVSSYDAMNSGVSSKLPGVVDYGSSSIEFAFDGGDDGQLLLSKGFDGINKGLNHSFAIVDSNGDTVWFTSRIFSFIKKYGATGDVISGAVKIEINSTLTTSGDDYVPPIDTNPVDPVDPGTTDPTNRGDWTTSSEWIE